MYFAIENHLDIRCRHPRCRIWGKLAILWRNGTTNRMGKSISHRKYHRPGISGRMRGLTRDLLDKVTRAHKITAVIFTDN